MNCALPVLLSFDFPGHDASCPYIIAFVGVEFIRPGFSGFDESNPYLIPHYITSRFLPAVNSNILAWASSNIFNFSTLLNLIPSSEVIGSSRLKVSYSFNSHFHTGVILIFIPSAISLPSSS